jgi:hypothetical protein
MEGYMEAKDGPDHLKADEKQPDDDEEILELTDMAAPDTEEKHKTIDLTDVLENDTIELTDVAAPAMKDKDDTIELTDVAEPLPKEEADRLQTDVTAGEPSLQVASPDPRTNAERAKVIEFGDAPARDEISQASEGIEWGETIDLDEIVGDEIRTTGEFDDEIVNSLGMNLAPQNAPDAVETGQESEIPALEDSALDPGQSLPNDAGARDASLPLDQVEAIVERVVERMYSEKIEGIIVQAIENAVKKEIEKISVLLQDSIGHGK